MLTALVKTSTIKTPRPNKRLKTIEVRVYHTAVLSCIHGTGNSAEQRGIYLK